MLNAVHIAQYSTRHDHHVMSPTSRFLAPAPSPPHSTLAVDLVEKRISLTLMFAVLPQVWSQGKDTMCL